MTVNCGPVSTDVYLCCGAFPWHRLDCPHAAEDSEMVWLRHQGWTHPDEMPTGEAFIEHYYHPDLIG